MRIGDFYPDDFKQQQAEERFQIGAVLRFHNEETNPNKIKIVVIIGFDAGKICVAYLFVNTKAAPIPALQALQYLILVEFYDFLAYDSYVDCSTIKYEKYPKTALLDLMQQDMSVYCGRLREENLAQVQEKVKQAKTIPLALKRRFGL